MKKTLKLLKERENNLNSTKNAKIANNKFLFQKNDIINEDSSIPFNINVYQINEQYKKEKIIFSVNNKVFIKTFKINMPIELDNDLLKRVYNRIKSLPNDWYEIFPVDHNVNRGFHFPDPWGETTKLLNLLEKEIKPVKPKFNHNKVSSKKFDKFNLNNMHIDSFEGMRYNSKGKRLKIWRYFINLGKMERTTFFSPLNPKMLDRLVPIDYNKNLFDSLILEAEREIPCVIIKIPGRDLKNKKIYGIKICTTHLLHSEYGAKDDFLAIINSLR